MTLGAVRSRTELFVLRREKISTRGKQLVCNDRKPMLPASTAETRIVEVPPVWATTADEVRRDVSQIKIKLADLALLTEKALLPGFAEDDDDDRRRKIEEAERHIAEYFHACDARLQEMRKSPPSNGAEVSLRENIERHLVQQLQSLGSEYRHMRRVYRTKTKGMETVKFRPDLSVAGDAESVPSSAGFFDQDEEAQTSSALSSARAWSGSTDPRFSAEQTVQLVMAERQTEEREEAIERVAESVGELAEIFKEVQVLVIEQGTVLDRIDYNIELAAVHVEKTVVELHQAKKYHERAGKLTCVYALLVLCSFMVGVIILKEAAVGV